MEGMGVPSGAPGGYGPRHREVVRLLRGLGSLTAEQMAGVAEAWDRVPARARDDAWRQVRTLGRTLPAEEGVDAAADARAEAARALHRNGSYDPTFAMAAWDAAMGVACAGRIGEGAYAVLVGPMRSALPWLEHAPDPRAA